MTSPRLNADFLSPMQLEEFGVANAADRNIQIHSTAVIVDFSAIEFGRNIRIDPFVVINCKRLQIKDYVHVASGCSLSGQGTIFLESFSGLSHHCLVFTSSDDYTGGSLTNPTVPSTYKCVKTADVSIGSHCIVGAATTILPGARLHEGAAVGARSLVTNELDAWTIHAGVPTRALRPRSKRCLELEHELRNAEKAIS